MEYLWLLLGKADLLFDPVIQGQIDLPPVELGISLGEEVFAFDDVSVPSGIQDIGYVQNQVSSLIHDSFGHWKVHEEDAFSDSLSSFLLCFIVCTELNIHSVFQGKSGSLTE